MNRNTFRETIQKYTDNRPIVINKLVDDGPIRIECPYCGSPDLKYDGCTCTLVGGKPDPNHYWCHAECNKCKRNVFYQHHVNQDRKTTNIWFTNDAQFDAPVKIVEKGIHNCCSGKYVHKDCGGIISEVYTQLDGITETRSLSYSFGPDHKRNFREFIKCDRCELREELE